MQTYENEGKNPMNNTYCMVDYIFDSTAGHLTFNCSDPGTCHSLEKKANSRGLARGGAQLELTDVKHETFLSTTTSNSRDNWVDTGVYEDLIGLSISHQCYITATLLVILFYSFYYL